MIKRAGVIITNNPKDYNINLINSAPIYWTYRRKNRIYHDLSHGWGSNSQWRTEFRLDVETENTFVYNLKGKYNLSNPAEEVFDKLRCCAGEGTVLELQEAIELVVNRQFIKCTKDNNDLWPYDFKYTEGK